MKFDNPTSLRMGMSGTIAGLRYRVVGRVVMDMEEAGQIYYWNEFNLVNDQGEFATLVFEETDSGAKWKMFTLFEPQNPLTAGEAARKRVGDPVNFFQGTPLRVTLVDESRVNFIEGQAPEGVEVGDVAHYFNAEAGNKMQVASWTGDEIEFYNGMDLPGSAVRNAFGLSADPSLNFQSGKNGPSPFFNWFPKLIGAAVVAIILYAAYSAWNANSRARGPVKSRLAESKLVVGKSGMLLGKNYRIENHAVAEIAQVGRIYDRHEYTLSDGEGGALLICGLNPETKNWFLFTPFTFEPAITPERAAAFRVGDAVDLEGYALKVSQLFKTGIQKTRGGTNDAVLYGFTAEAPPYFYLARWDEKNITLYRGQTCTEKSVLSAFK